MSNKRIRRTFRLRRQQGQALPLAAIGLFIMALAVVATLNLGQAVHQKIKLQNTSDAAVYSLAALEARAFNFIAFTNRVQIVHYNTAMAMQSYLTFAGYCIGIVGTLVDMLQDITLALRQGCAKPPPACVPFCSALGIWSPIVNALKAGRKILVKFYEILHDFTTPVVEAMSLFNKYAIWQLQFLRAMHINTYIVSAMKNFVTDDYLDPNMTYQDGNTIWNMIFSNVLNSLEFQAAFDRGAGLNPFWMDAAIKGFGDIKNFKSNPTDPHYKDAYKVMTEIANASRSHKNIYDRSGAAYGIWLIANIGGKKMGATKFVEEGKPKPQIKEIRKKPINYAVGDTLASDDYIHEGFGFATILLAAVILLPGPTGMRKLGDGIRADKDKGEHYGYKTPWDGGCPGGYPVGCQVLLPPLGVVSNTFKKLHTNEHPWPGLSPYFKFKPSSDENADYNQPSTWMFLNKHHSGFQTGEGQKGRPWHYNFTYHHQGSQASDQDKQNEYIGGHKTEGSVSLDTTIGGDRSSFSLPGLNMEGLNVVSRGMVYYHRPGAWDEHPNMFNPFWRARLAPVAAALVNIWDRLMKKVTAGKGNDDVVANTVLSTVKNFVSDLFLRSITAVMTH